MNLIVQCKRDIEIYKINLRISWKKKSNMVLDLWIDGKDNDI